MDNKLEPQRGTPKSQTWKETEAPAITDWMHPLSDDNPIPEEAYRWMKGGEAQFLPASPSGECHLCDKRGWNILPRVPRVGLPHSHMQVQDHDRRLHGMQQMALAESQSQAPVAVAPPTIGSSASFWKFTDSKDSVLV